MARDLSDAALAKTAARGADGWWLILDARGVPLQAVKTKGGHPCYEPGEKFNVMRTFSVDRRPDLALESFDRHRRKLQPDAAKIAARTSAPNTNPMVQQMIEQALAPLLERLAAIEARLNGETDG